MTENPYIFPHIKKNTTALNYYLTHAPIPCFIVNHLAHFYFIAEITKKTSFIIKNTQKTSPSLYLLSPPNVVSYLGIRWWLSFVRKATPIVHQYSITHILDCDNHGGLAMAALRLGQKHIFFESKIPQYKIIQNRASTSGAKVFTNKPITFNLLDLNFKKNNLAK